MLLTVTDSAGKTNSGLVWRIRLAPYGTRDDEKNWPQGVSEVTVTVARTDTPNASSVTLRTLKLVPGRTITFVTQLPPGVKRLLEVLTALVGLIGAVLALFGLTKK